MTESRRRVDPDRRRFDSEALEALNDVYRFAFYLAGNGDEADDLVQETYVRAYTNWTQYETGTNCVAWLRTICRNVFLRQRSRAAREPAVPDPELEALASVAVHAAARASGVNETTFASPDIAEALRKGLRKIPEFYRTAVMLVDIEGMNYVEASTELDIPLGTLRSRLFRGRRLLQQELLEHAADLGLVTPAEEGI